MTLYEETSISLSDIEEMGNRKAYEYYLFIMERKKEELKQMEEAQAKGKGDKGFTVKCDAPEGAPSWEAWEEDVRRKDAEKKKNVR